MPNTAESWAKCLIVCLGVTGEFGGLLREVEPRASGGGDQADMN